MPGRPRDLADTLALLEPAAAQPLLDQHLAADWARLPSGCRAVLQAACVQGGQGVVRALAEAGEPPVMLAVAARDAQRPVLVTGAERRRAVWQQVRGMGRMELEGLALGPQLPAAQALARIRLLLA